MSESDHQSPSRDGAGMGAEMATPAGKGRASS